MSQDRYQFVRELGRGGMGVVNLAFDTWLKREVAIKSVIRPPEEGPAAWNEIMQRLIREAQAAGRLHHPHIIAIYDILPDPESPSIVMEFVRGKTLADAAALGQPADPRFICEILKQCAAALDHAHSRGIVHRDIKPSNIMLDENGAVRLADFGVAKLLNATTDLTHGLAIGTLEYMSPEQLNAQAVDGRTDQYSLAVVTYRLLTGCKIFQADTIASWCSMVLTQNPLPPSQRIAGLSVAVDEVLAKAMAKQPSARYASCAEFVASLHLALSAEAAASPAAQGRLPGWALAVAGALLAAVAIAAAIHFAGNSGKDADTAKATKSTASAVLPVQTVAIPPDSPSAGQTWKNPHDGADYVYLAAATFMMGCIPGDNSCDEDESPHEVHIDHGYWIGRTEVTVRAYRRFTGATGASMPPAPAFNPSWELDTHPIVNVTWNEARAFCLWDGGRLPTDAEWEYAARGGKALQKYVSGESISAGIANYNGKDSFPFTAPVGSFPPNGFGLFDVSGNAAEWVDGGEAVKQPVRGGSWNSYPEGLRLSQRLLTDPNRRVFTFGARCAL